MLQSIRDRTQGWIAGIIISVLILSFALWGIHSYFLSSANSNVIAEVDGVEITKGHLAVAYERLRRQLQSQAGSADINDAGLRDRAMQALINIQVLKQASLSQDYYIDSDQVDAYLENMPEFQVDGQFSVTRFQQALASTVYTPSEFLELIKTSLLIDQPRLGTIFTSFSLPSEISSAIHLVNQERDINYVVFPFASFAKENVVVSEEDVKKYYNAHQNEFKTPEQVSVEYVELSANDLMNHVKPTEDELKNFYNENASLFAQATRWKLDILEIPVELNASKEQVDENENRMKSIKQKASEGVSFATLAKDYAITHKRDYAEEWVTLNQLPISLQKSLQSLTKPNQLSDSIETSDGVFIVKVIDFKEAQPSTYEEAKEKVKQMYSHQKAQELFTSAREELAALTYENPDSLKPAADKLGLSVHTTELFSRDKGSNDITSNSKLRQAAFSEEVLHMQNNSDVLQKSADSVVVLRLKSHLPSSLLSLNAVSQQISEKLKIERMDANALNQVEKIKKSLESGENREIAIQSIGGTWQNVGYISRHDAKVDSAILEAAFSMQKPNQTGMSTYAVAKVPNGYAIVSLGGVRDGQPSGEEENDIYAEQIQNYQGLLEYALYKLSLMNHAKIINK